MIGQQQQQQCMCVHVHVCMCVSMFVSGTAICTCTYKLCLRCPYELMLCVRLFCVRSAPWLYGSPTRQGEAGRVLRQLTGAGAWLSSRVAHFVVAAASAAQAAAWLLTWCEGKHCLCHLQKCEAGLDWAAD